MNSLRLMGSFSIPSLLAGEREGEGDLTHFIKRLS